MNKLIIFCCLIATVTTKAIAQQSSINQQLDSIVALLPQLRDTAKIEALVTLCRLSLGLPERKGYIQMHLEEARRQKNVEAEAQAFSDLTSFYYAQFDTDSVYIIGEQAIRFTRQNQLYSKLFYLQQQLIRRYLHDEQVLTALRYAEEVYHETKELQETISTARILAVIADIHYSLDQFEEAERYFLESIALANQDRQPGSTLFVSSYFTLAFMCNYTNQWQQMSAYTDSMFVEIDRLQQPELDERRWNLYYFWAYELRVQQYAGLNQPEQALQEIRKAEAIYDPRWNEENISNAYILDNMYGEYYFAAGDYRRAMERFDRLLNYYEETEFTRGVIDYNKRRAEMFARMGDHANALDAYMKVVQKTDSVNKKQFYTQINEFRTIYETEKAEMEVRRQQAEVERERLVNSVLMIACALMALTAMLLYLFYRQKQIAYRVLVSKIQQSAKEPVIPTNQPDMIDRDIFEQLNRLIVEKQIYLQPDINLDTVAQLTGIGRNYISQAVNLCKGEGFTAFINEYRIKEAVRLLSEVEKSKLNIEEIVVMTGFNDRTTFYRAFKKSTGVSPSLFRKNLSVREK